MMVPRVNCKYYSEYGNCSKRENKFFFLKLREQCVVLDGDSCDDQNSMIKPCYPLPNRIRKSE